MTPAISRGRLAAVLIAATLIGNAQPASALSLRTTVSTIYQVGTGAAVHLGHVVSARTAYNRLYAGGTFNATCANSDMLPITGQRFITSEAFSGGVALVVTIPQYQPAEPAMPGFYSLPRGSQVTCTYNWTSRAVESSFTIGAGGVSFPTGGSEQSEGGTQVFYMKVPGVTDPNGNNVCIP
jgi:hypothetical protein